MGEHYQMPVIDDALKARLATDNRDAIPVTVTFASALAPAELDALGLYAGTDQPSTIAYGTLSPDAVRQLAARSGVKSLSLSPILPARPRGSDKPTNLDKIQLLLQTKLEQRPSDKHAVIVHFRGRATKDTLKSLGLTAMVDEVANGSLDKAAVLRLAERPDVRRIEAAPEMRPLR
jgi:hypothetical protein